MDQQVYTIGDKEYTREELLKFGKEHYPKFYWIYRGVGIGLMFVGIISALCFLIPSLIYKDIDLAVYYAGMITFFIVALIGAILFAVSFVKRPDADYINHAIRYYEKVNTKQIKSEEKQKIRTTKKENGEVDLLLKYKELLDSGVITQEEFDKKKKEILGD